LILLRRFIEGQRRGEVWWLVPRIIVLGTGTEGEMDGLGLGFGYMAYVAFGYVGN
jgi:hypothetical protein